MASPHPLRDQALDNLRFIRQTMERAGSFTAVPGWGQVAVGVTALAAAFFASRHQTSELWLVIWLGVAIVALAIGGATMVRKAYAVSDPILSGPGRRFGLSFLPPMLVGGLLTVVLYRAALWSALPGTWLLLYGTGFVTGGAFSVDDTLSFNELKGLLKTTDGNLSVHARRLEEAQYITCAKSFEGRIPKTEYRLTAAGRRALERYLDHMEALIHATRQG